MILRKNAKQKRHGAAVVEMAVVCLLLFTALFGILEYCRMLFVMHMANNAARDAARFAVVHTNGGTMPGEPTAISKADIIAIVTTGKLGTINVGAGMAGMEKNIQGYTVDVFCVDPAGLALATPVVQELSGSQWNSGSFSGKIAVRITGNYVPISPALLFMANSIPFQITVMESSEAN